jgi:hypothetical protein
VLRRYLRERGDAGLTIRILSAEYGLIAPETALPIYDRYMDSRRAEVLRPSILAGVRALMHGGGYTRLGLCLGQAYRHALAGYERWVPPDVRIQVLAGAVGKQAAALHDWLWGIPPATRSGAARRSAAIRFRGQRLALTLPDIQRQAREALAAGRGEPGAYQAWYVEVDGQRVAPKWLVSCLTGQPVSVFTTDAARRLLAALGVEVQRV